jgi:hypothetical protein
MDDEHEDGYAGPATLTVDGRELAVRVVLDARHEPMDGRLHWFGRLSPGQDAAPALESALTAPAARIELSTATGRADARIGELDLWGRYRVTGVGTPPYAPAEPPLDEG